uniref:SKP1 component POZ domain-containing protein n=1 Tax=Glossina palpalis gambiensis TaxID=67801 RepID=A0A1B0C3I6_9MUSC
MPDIRLESSDNETFIVDIQVAKCSDTIKTVLKDHEIDDCKTSIPLPNVNSAILRKILEWACYHKEHVSTDKQKPADMLAWEADFLNICQVDLFELISAASYLNVGDLLDAAYEKVKKMLGVDKIPKEIREMLRIREDSYEELRLEKMPYFHFESSDNEIFIVDKQVGKHAGIGVTMWECEWMKGLENVDVLAPNVNSAILRKILQWACYHKEHAYEGFEEPADMLAWEADFLNICQVDLFELISGANALNVGDLFYAACEKMDKMLGGKMPEEIREMLRIREEQEAAEAEWLEEISQPEPIW